MSATEATAVLTANDFASEQDVRWCPGCGDYSILAQMKKMLPGLGVAPENTVFVSGIGCSSRFPYYLNTYGLHSIHGRAPAIATGLKTVRPDLSVWVITGDGDALSIGGNHLMHAIRRNVDVNIVLFNNRIYGLTKGQYSPTSLPGHVTKSTPMGSVDYPAHPLSVAIGCEATFVARSVDVHVKHLGMVLERAARHRGTSFVEVYQNCNVFNDEAFAYATDRKTKADHVIEVEHGKPLVFGVESNRGIVLDGFDLRAVDLAEVDESDLLVHDETADMSLAWALARMSQPVLPEALGVLRAVERPCYEHDVQAQIEAARSKGAGDLGALLAGGDTWTVS